MACRRKMDFKMIIGMTHVAFSPFLLTHNLAVSAEFSSHRKFPFNSQEAHVNSADPFHRAERKGVSFPEAFYEALAVVSNQKKKKKKKKRKKKSPLVYLQRPASKCSLGNATWPSWAVNHSKNHLELLLRVVQALLSVAAALKGLGPSPRQDSHRRHQQGPNGNSKTTVWGHRAGAPCPLFQFSCSLAMPHPKAIRFRQPQPCHTPSPADAS